MKGSTCGPATRPCERSKLPDPSRLRLPNRCMKLPLLPHAANSHSERVEPIIKAQLAAPPSLRFRRVVAFARDDFIFDVLALLVGHLQRVPIHVHQLDLEFAELAVARGVGG